ncbi:hypothetical protein PSA7680_00829 [Pseudoruegeria aquimaris]|uniref:DUF2189 domain-containing protein n=1 Tax=Pseudoruegeria aquimaris TaxID=393663 RepID=A0A1Y5RP72_9RHOB|nr:DUF2189 domain-containing protein [Pseudoruegeria aquimaris]SLN21792.1 hypothetical protein PSA7680_00829 [Pseudoruegeria aquimaris]
MAQEPEDPTQPRFVPPPRDVLPEINTVTWADIAAALTEGFADFRARAFMSGFFGLFYALFGLLIVWCLASLGKIWMIIPAAVGFPLVAPFAAAGLYEMSRRLQAGIPFGWGEILTVMADQRKREMGWMAFVTLFIFWVWMYQVRLWLALILKDSSFSDFEGFLQIVFFTPPGWTFLAIGTCVGAFLSAVLFTVTVIAMPMLMDREIDFISAMLVSVQVVKENPVVMLGWAAVISVAMLISMIPAFLGLIVTLPVLGHTTWHLYRRAVQPA